MPRLSLGRLMVLVAIVAVDCWVARNARSVRGWEFDIPLFPMVTILVIGFVVVPRDRTRRSSFIGFQAMGWAVLLVYARFLVMAPEWTWNLLSHTHVFFCRPVTRFLTRGSPYFYFLIPYEEWIAILLTILSSTLPQLLVALLGGLLAHRFAKGMAWRP